MSKYKNIIYTKNNTSFCFRIKHRYSTKFRILKIVELSYYSANLLK